MKPTMRTLLLLGLGLSLLGGCISQKRTPYHEISLTDKKLTDLDFYWPFYMGDGRSHYALWPLIKKSPGCFAVLPFYNYDHGIHDFALLATHSSKDKQTRVFPFWWSDQYGWLLFPAAYYLSDDGGIAAGSPFLFNYFKEKQSTYIQSLLYYSKRTPKESQTVLAPFISYTTAHDKEDYSIWTPIWRRGVETTRLTIADNKLLSRREYWNVNPFFSLSSFKHFQEWIGTEEKPYETATIDQSRSCTFPFYWSWDDHLTGESGDLLIPFFYRAIANRDAPGTWATPLAGWGADKSWWYALNCGRYKTMRWCLPLAFWNIEPQSDGSTARQVWTPLAYLDTTHSPEGETKVKRWGVGPLLPLVANGTETTFEVGLGLLLHHRHDPIDSPWWKYTPCDICAPRDTRSLRESIYSNLLLGLLYDHAIKRKYEAASLAENRPIYVETQEDKYGLLLWQHDRSTLHGAEHLPEGAIYPAETGYRYSLLGGLWAREKYTEKTVKDYAYGEGCEKGRHYSSADYTQLDSETESLENTYGWVLWKDSSVILRDAEQNQKIYSAFFTPLFGASSSLYRTADGKTYDGGSDLSLLLSIPYHRETVVRYDTLAVAQAKTKTVTRRQGILGDFLWKSEVDTYISLNPPENAIDLIPETPEVEEDIYSRSNILSYWLYYHRTSEHSNYAHEISHQLSKDSAWFLSLLYRDSFDSNKELTYCTACQNDESKCSTCDDTHKCSNSMRREETVTHTNTWLMGLLSYHDFEDTRIYEAHGDAETCKVDIYKDDYRLLLGIPYKSSRSRDGAIKRRGFFGLLFDQDTSPAEKTSTFGVLGYLYRNNLHADGTREHLVFPFVRKSSNDTTDTWSFSFLGRFFKVERLPDGEMDWSLFWL